MRLQKYLAGAGVASRRACEQMIKDGKVTVNGRTAVIGDVAEENDVVECNGQVIKPVVDKVYIMLNKPVGVVTTASDERGRKTVMDLIDTDYRVYPVGRLDINTSGLLLLTNDGDLANKLTHPRFQVDKTYKAIVRGEVTRDELEALKQGVVLEDGVTAPAKVKLVKYEDGNTYIEITIREGRNRQVRRMFEAVSHRVLGLRRIKIGGLTLKNMDKGEYRELTEQELEYLKRITSQGNTVD